MYDMLDCLTKIKQLIWIWLMEMMLKEQLKQSNSDNFNQVRSFNSPFTFLELYLKCKTYSQFLISIYGCRNKETSF